MRNFFCVFTRAALRLGKDLGYSAWISNVLTHPPADLHKLHSLYTVKVTELGMAAAMHWECWIIQYERDNWEYWESFWIMAIELCREEVKKRAVV